MNAILIESVRDASGAGLGFVFGLALLAGLLAWVGWRFWESQIGHATIGLKIGAVFVPAGIAGLVYWLAALAFKIPAAKDMTEFAFAKLKR